jgi:adenine phosphoribosyltransferase
MDLKDAIRTIPDYPIPGIMFRDITTLLGDPRAFRACVDALVALSVDLKIDKGAVAHQLAAGFIPLRKKGKLPHKTIAVEYALEYGVDSLEMHLDGCGHGERVLLIDDLIATGGTAVAALQLLRQAGATVPAAAFVVDLPDLGGAAKLRALDIDVSTLVSFGGH